MTSHNSLWHFKWPAMSSGVKTHCCKIIIKAKLWVVLYTVLVNSKTRNHDTLNFGIAQKIPMWVTAVSGPIRGVVIIIESRKKWYSHCLQVNRLLLCTQPLFFWSYLWVPVSSTLVSSAPDNILNTYVAQVKCWFGKLTLNMNSLKILKGF